VEFENAIAAGLVYPALSSGRSDTSEVLSIPRYLYLQSPWGRNLVWSVQWRSHPRIRVSMDCAIVSLIDAREQFEDGYSSLDYFKFLSFHSSLVWLACSGHEHLVERKSCSPLNVTQIHNSHSHIYGSLPEREEQPFGIPRSISMAGQSTSLTILWRDKADPESYEQARVQRIFNCKRPRRYPLAIAFAKTEKDIIEVVELAIKKKCSISVRSGGHSWPVWSVQDDSILLDFGCYSEIVLNEKTGVVRVSPSTTGRELHSYLFEKGRFFCAGHCPGVGVGGALLCGGMGWNCNVRHFSIPHDRG
jgi:hypothetical protein